jgi:hypothetical protein
MDIGSEDWYLELVEVDGQVGEKGSNELSAEPILMCQVYSLEYRASSVKNLRFSEFKLNINKFQGSNHRSIDSLPREYQSSIARQPGRRLIKRENLEESYGSVRMGAEILDDYDSTLAFIKVYA